MTNGIEKIDNNFIESQKQEYYQIITDKAEYYKSSQSQTVEYEKKWFIDRIKYLEELRQEIESIKSCNSSDSSSVCTNFTNDSGSFFLLEGTKVPCDYITKPYVPFDEINRCQVKAEPALALSEYLNPYYALPFPGQKMKMRQLCKTKDKYFTYMVRSRFGIRDRLHIPPIPFNEELIGTSGKKYNSQLATEWDEYYIHELQNRPRIRNFKPRTVMHQVRESMRKKFQSFYIQESIAEQTLVSDLEEKYAKEVLEFRDMCAPLFSQWEELFYRGYMRRMQELKPCYAVSDDLKRELKKLNDQYTRLNMNIIYGENDLRKGVVFQNFHYLLKNIKWREEHDWIHKDDDDVLEDFAVSIQKRHTRNLRVRDKDDAWAVKEFYDNQFIIKPIEVVFPTPQSLLDGIAYLKIQSFLRLLELHFTLWILSNLEYSYTSFMRWFKMFTENRRKFVQSQYLKQYAIETEADLQKRETLMYLDKPFKKCVGKKPLRKITALCNQIYLELFSKKDEEAKEDSEIVHRFREVANLVMNILGTDFK